MVKLLIDSFIIPIIIIMIIYYHFSEGSAKIFSKLNNSAYKERVYASISDMKKEINNPSNSDDVKKQLKVSLNKRKKYWLFFMLAIFFIFVRIIYKN